MAAFSAVAELPPAAITQVHGPTPAVVTQVHGPDSTPTSAPFGGPLSVDNPYLKDALVSNVIKSSVGDFEDAREVILSTTDLNDDMGTQQEIFMNQCHASRALIILGNLLVGAFAGNVTDELPIERVVVALRVAGTRVHLGYNGAGRLVILRIYIFGSNLVKDQESVLGVTSTLQVMPVFGIRSPNVGYQNNCVKAVLRVSKNSLNILIAQSNQGYPILSEKNSGTAEAKAVAERLSLLPKTKRVIIGVGTAAVYTSHELQKEVVNKIDAGAATIVLVFAKTAISENLIMNYCQRIPLDWIPYVPGTEASSASL